MDAPTATSESIILTASHLNNRTFQEEESWNSLQSTILAGQISHSEDSDKLATVNEEEEASELIEEDEDLLNMNIDAISDSEDVFFDCATIFSPRPFSKIVKSPMRVQAPRAKIPNITSVALQIGFDPSSLSYLSYDGSSLEKEKTGTLLSQMIADMKDIKSHAQSTPKSSPNTTEFSSFSEFCSTQSDATEDQTSSSETGKVENKKKLFFVDKENGNTLPQTICPKPLLKSPAVSKRPVRRVAQIKEFFENYSRKNKSPKNKSLKSPKKVKLELPNQQSYSLKIQSEERAKSKIPKYTKLETSKLRTDSLKIQLDEKPRSISPSSKIPKYTKLLTSKLRTDSLKIQLDEKPRLKSPSSQKLDIEASTLQSCSSKIQLEKKASSTSQKLEVPKQNGGHEIQTEENSKSRNPKRRSSGQNKKVKTPKSIYSQETFKLPSSSKRESRHLRISSCSEFSAAGSSDLSQSSRRSKSLSDASQPSQDSKDDKVELLVQALKMNRVSTRPHFLVNQRSHLRMHKRSPKKSEKSISEIVNRKSLGPNVTVKPVKELRKIFSPRVPPKENRVKKR